MVACTLEIVICTPCMLFAVRHDIHAEITISSDDNTKSVWGRCSVWGSYGWPNAVMRNFKFPPCRPTENHHYSHSLSNHTDCYFRSRHTLKRRAEPQSLCETRRTRISRQSRATLRCYDAVSPIATPVVSLEAYAYKHSHLSS